VKLKLDGSALHTFLPPASLSGRAHDEINRRATYSYADHRQKAGWLVVTDHSEARVTVWMGEDLRDELAEYVNWRYESESQWVREAVQTRIAVEDALAAEGRALPDDPDQRRHLVETVVAAGVAAADLPDGE